MNSEALTGFRLSPQQAAVWASQQNGQPLLTRAVFRIEGRLDAAALHAALRQVMNRHEILRTTFRQRVGLKFPLQVIGDLSEPEWRIVDCSAQPRAEQDRQLAQLLT